MLLLISPAKSLNENPSTLKKKSMPRFLSESQALVDILKKKTPGDIKKLMSVSDKIAELNVHRYHNFKTPFNLKNAKQAVLAFQGDVYRGLEADTFDEADFEFAQQHLRILSGLYGLLKPLDLMQPYRLEMGTALSNGHGKNLYQFWDEKITQMINKDVKASKSKAIINLASNEYFKSVKKNLLKAPLYNVQFKEERNGQFKIISFSAKKARGMMAQFVIKNRLTDPEHLKGFDMENYVFNDEMSSEKNFVFTR